MRLRLTAVVGTMCAFSAPAEAQIAAPSDSPTALSWSRSPGTEACPDLAELAKRVSGHLKRDVFVSPTLARVLIEATIARGASVGYRVRIFVSSPDEATPGAREIDSQSASCNDAVDATALAIALMIDPNALVAPAPAPSPAGGPIAAEEAAPPVEASSASRSIDSIERPPFDDEPPPIEQSRKLRVPLPASSAWRARFGLSGLVDIGQLPRAADGIFASVRERRESTRLGFELGVSYLAPQRAEIEGNVGGEFSLLASSLAGVWTPYRESQLEASLLLGAQAGRLSAEGFGWEPSRSQTSWLISATLDGEVALPLFGSHFELMLRAGGGVALWRDTFEGTPSSGTEPRHIFRPSALFGAAGFGVGFSP